MLRRLVFGFSLCLLTHSSSGQNDTTQLVRVLTFNILHGATTNHDFDLDRIAQVIINADPDLVALQEVDFKTRRAQRYDLATELGWRTKLAPLFARAMPYDDGEYGEGILSRYTFIASRAVPLPHLPEQEPRVALEVTTQLPSGDTIHFIGTHLDHLESDEDRLLQARALNASFSSNQFPTILAGDLNDIPGSNAISTLETIWQPSYDQSRPQNTYPSDFPVEKIDYVMYFPKNRWRVVGTEVICDTVASDHCAYLVTLELLNK